MSTQQGDRPSERRPRRTRAGVFDIRVVIGLLLGIYGLVLTIYGLVATSEDDLAKADGTNLNLWTGIALLVAAVVFVVWARVRPVLVPVDQAAADRDTDIPPPTH
jgi:hypothetical protein